MDIQLNLDPQLGGDGHKDPFLQNENNLNLPQLINRIIQERGSFLNISEDSLTEEIESSPQEKFEDDLFGSEDGGNEEKEVYKQSHEEFMKQRNEVIQLINSAYNETALSLDFVSLLASAVKPANSTLTMSPHLKQFIPAGSLNSSKIHTQAKPDDPKIGQGWKLESLERISSSLRDASIRLTEEVMKERIYWNRVNQALSNKEVIFKTRDDGVRAVGVKYGYGDAGSTYYDKGIAILKRERDGDVLFKPINKDKLDKVQKIVRVKILSKIDNDYIVTGISSIEKYLGPNKSIEDEIERARLLLFEEELYYQLIREATSMMSFQVQIVSNKVIIELSDEIIEIEAKNYDPYETEEPENYSIRDQSKINSKRADYIVKYLKLMLCCYHKHQLDLRQNVPTLLNKQRQAHHHPLLLRSLLGLIKHEEYLNVIDKMVNSVFDKHSNEFESNVSKFHGLSEEDYERNPFIRCITPPSSNVVIKTVNKRNHLMRANLKVGSTSTFCNLVINLLVVKYENKEDEKENRNGVNMLSVDFTEIRDLEECLQWTIDTFMDGA